MSIFIVWRRVLSFQCRASNVSITTKISQNKWPEISQMPTRISPKTLSNILEGYDIDIIISFYNGFTVGFHIQSEGNVSERIFKNLKSA